MTQLLFKIVARDTWLAVESDGQFAGAEIDLEHGFIHLSTGEQTQETADLYFAGRSNLVLVALDSTALGDGLRWEPPQQGQRVDARKDQLFPHYYGTLTADQVVWVKPIQQDEIGRHLIELD